MLELVLTVCALAHPTACQDEHLLMDSDTTPLQCTMSAPPFIARWGSEHPQWFVQRWTCRYPKPEKNI